MKNKIIFVIMIFVSIICLNSCKEKEFELYKYDGTEFTLEKSIDVLEKNGWIKNENSHGIDIITKTKISYAVIYNFNLDIEQMKDYVVLVAPKRIQKESDRLISVEFNVFASADDAKLYYDFLFIRDADRDSNWNHYYAISENIVIDTDSEEPVSLIPLNFVPTITENGTLNNRGC